MNRKLSVFKISVNKTISSSQDAALVTLNLDECAEDSIGNPFKKFQIIINNENLLFVLICLTQRRRGTAFGYQL